MTSHNRNKLCSRQPAALVYCHSNSISLQQKTLWDVAEAVPHLCPGAPACLRFWISLPTTTEEKQGDMNKQTNARMRV